MWGYIVAGLVVLGNLVFLFWYKKKYVVSHGNEMSEKIIASVPDMIFMVDYQYVIRKIYNADPGKLNVPEEKLVGMNLRSCVDPECVDLVVNGLKAALASDQVSEVEYSVTMNGRKTYYEGRYKRVQEGLVACFERDITERKKTDVAIQQNESLLNAILDNMPVPVIVKDVDDGLKYIFWNKQCELLGGYLREEIVGKNDIEIYGEERGNYYRNVDNKIIQEGGSFRRQEEYITPDGKRHVSIVNKNVISNDLHRWMFATRWDVSDLIEIQEQLQEANQQLKLAFAVTSTVPIVWDLQEDCIRLKFSEFKENNEGFFKDRDGLTLEEVIRDVHPAERENVSQAFYDLKSGLTEVLHKEVRYDISGKYEEYYDLYMSVEKRGDNGMPVRVIGTLRNITKNKIYERRLMDAKRRVEEIQKMNQLILDHSNSGLVYLNPDYVVEWENLTKYSNHPLAARYKPGVCCYKTVMGQEQPCPGCVMQRTLLSGKREVKEVSFGENLVVEITATPVFNGGDDTQVRGVVLKYEDVSERHRVAREWKRAKEAAENSDKLKSMFISNMSHEIRTPLNAIVGFSELLTQAEDGKEREEYVEIINRNNELLLQLINDILDLSKIEAGTLEFVYDMVDINEMMRGLELSNQRKVIDNLELEVAFTSRMEECVIYTEQNRVMQVLSNFLSNALKFTAKGFIHFGYEKEGDELCFFVADTGKGIAVDKQPDIFKRFVKLDSFTNGTGLGLAICETIVLKLGGRIGVVSEEGKGSTFWFTLPLRQGKE